MDKNTLSHHGVKGMRWGVRKRRNVSDDSAKTTAIRKKHISEMTNQELRDANNRLQLERQYKDLTKKTNIGKKAAKEYIATAALITGVVGATATYKKYGAPIAGKVLDAIGNYAVKGLKI
jgi:hypothetical protein